MMTSSVFVSSLSSSLIGDYIGTESCFDLYNNSDDGLVNCIQSHDYIGTESCFDLYNNSDRGLVDCIQSRDYIGTESCFDLYNNIDDGLVDCIQTRGKREQGCQTKMTKREIPPPIPSLARNNNMPCHRTYRPWVLKRYYTSDGRLIIKEVKVRFSEYFRAHRSNGRLTLHLVSFNNKENDDENEACENENDDNGNNKDDDDDHDNSNSNIVETSAEDDEFPEIEDSIVKCPIADDDDDNSNSNIVETSVEDNEFPEIEDSIVKCPIAEDEIVAENGGKCFKYNSVRASPTCFMGLPVPAIRPVHI